MAFKQIDMRTVIGEDEDWIANPNDTESAPKYSELVDRLAWLDVGYTPGGTWDYSLDDPDTTTGQDRPAPSPAVSSFRYHLSGLSVSRECHHDLQLAKCRCSSTFGVFCIKCDEYFCSKHCPRVGEESICKGNQAQPVPPAVDHRSSSRGGHRQGMGRGQRILHREYRGRK